MQTSGQAYAFVQVSNAETLTSAIAFVNRTRRIPIYYHRIIQTAPRRGWSALIFDGSLIDHYLLRNLSGRLRTQAFGLTSYNLQISYRLHVHGQTKAAYESHLALMITDRLRRLLAAGSVEELDLSEPADRLILQRYHDYQHKRTWTQPSARDTIPEPIVKYYGGDVTKLKDLLKPGIDPMFVAEVLEPGYSAQTAMQRILDSLALPYLSNDEILVHGETVGQAPFRVEGLSILKAQQWTDLNALPLNWTVIAPQQWKSA